jgi:hypothetical protein
VRTGSKLVGGAGLVHENWWEGNWRGGSAGVVGAGLQRWEGGEGWAGAEKEAVAMAGGCAGAQAEARAGDDEDAPDGAAELGTLPSGKLSFARRPRNLVAAASYACAASSAVSNVPSQTRAAFFGSRISAAHFPHGRCRTPRYLRFFAGGAGAGAGTGTGTAPLIPSPAYPPPPSPCSPNP